MAENKRRRVRIAMEQVSVKRVRRSVKRRIKLEDAPPVNSIRDLIELGRTIKFYKNLDSVMLWRITPYLEELDKMIGMTSLKETVFYQVIYYLQGMNVRNSNSEYLHTVIYGAPGTGKTTVAQIIGKIYQAMRILSPKGEFKVAHRDDFIASYLGQTAIKTKKLLKSCIGGVLLIDEAYALGPRNNDRDSFAKEAIDTLNAFLSEHKNDFCCIIAGYEDEIRKCFFAMNSGLERRFPWVHRIEEYSPGELYRIFEKMVGEMGWEIAFDQDDLIELVEQNKDFFQFAGGDMETYITKCKMVHARRVFSMSKDHKFVLTKTDLINALEFMKKNNVKDNKDSGPPQWMYM